MDFGYNRYPLFFPFYLFFYRILISPAFPNTEPTVTTFERLKFPTVVFSMDPLYSRPAHVFYGLYARLLVRVL